MKFKFFLIAAMAACATLFAACEEDPNKGKDDVIPVEPKEEAFEVRVSNIAQYSVTMNVSPKSGFSNVGYYAAITTPAELAEFDNNWEALISEEFWYYVDYGMTMAEVMEMLLTTGSASASFYTLDENSTYIAFAAGFDGEGLTTEVATAEFTTQACPELVTEECAFTIDATASSYYVDITIGAANAATAWYCDYLPAGDYSANFTSPAELGDYMPNFMKSAAYQLDKPVSAVVNMITSKGNQSFNVGGLTPNTEYVFFVCGLDKYGRATTDVVIKEVATKEYIPSAASIKANIRLFSNDDLVKYDSSTFPADYFPAGGYAIQFYAEEFSEEAVAWSVLGAGEDATDDVLIYNFIYNDRFNQLPDYRYFHMGGVPLNTPLYLFSVAKDSQGEFGAIDRQVKTFSAGDVTDIADLRFDVEEEAQTSSVRFSSFNELNEMPMGENKIHINMGERAPLHLKK